MIRPLVSDEPRGKVALRYNCYSWVPVLRSFDNSGGKGLLLLGLFSVSEPLKWFWRYEAVSGRLISPKILGLNAGNYGLFWAVPDKFSDCY